GGVAIEVNLGTSNVDILNVYMPYHYIQIKEQHYKKLGNISSYIESLNKRKCIITGSWNANLREFSNSQFCPAMKNVYYEKIPPNSCSHLIPTCIFAIEIITPSKLD
ncbi:unnamed protein product, partial [Meganyctiphanes norvegica]